MQEAGTWKNIDTNKQQIIALTAALEKAAKSQPKMPYPNKPKPSPHGGAPREKEKQEHKGYVKWKTTSPKANEAHEKVNNGHTYDWCPNHAKDGLWVAHKPAECFLRCKKPGTDNVKKKQGTQKTTYDLNNIKPNA